MLVEVKKNQDEQVMTELETIKSSEYLPAGEGPEPDEKVDEQDFGYKRLIEYFSDNKEAMNLFLAFCFLIQRVNTGGVSKAELQALSNITKKMVDDFGLDTEFLNYIVSSVSNNKAIYNVFVKNSSEFNIVQRQHPKRLCEILAAHLTDDYGFVLTLALTGNLREDLKRVESVLSLSTKTHISELTAIKNKVFTIRSVNPWGVLLDDYKQSIRLDKNTLITAFKHAPSKAKNVYLIKSLVTAREWLLRRIPKEEEIDNSAEVVERLSKFDAVMSRDEFLGITETFVSFSNNRPYRSTALESRMVIIRDVEGDEQESVDDEVEEYFYDDDSYIEKPKGFLAKAKSLFSRKKGDLIDIDIEDEDTRVAYSIFYVDYAGVTVSHQNLLWVHVFNDDHEMLMFRQYRQIFGGCTLVVATDTSIQVGRDIVGSWRDVAIGYFMAVNYSVTQEEEDELVE